MRISCCQHRGINSFLVMANSDTVCQAIESPGFVSMREVERSSEAFCADARDPAALDCVNAYRKFRLNCIHTSLGLLTSSGVPEYVLVSGRLKRLRSIRRKLIRSKRHGIRPTVNGMDDVIGFRVVCRSFDDAVGLGNRVEEKLGATVKNYIDGNHPLRTGYRAIHGIVRFRQPFVGRGERVCATVRFEIQVRTWLQHLWACWCESYGEQAKEGFRNVEDRPDVQRIQVIAERLRMVSENVRVWEESNRSELQTELPEFSGSQNIALTWVSGGVVHFETLVDDVQQAIAQLNMLERESSIEPLLLVGVAERQRLKRVLLRTHPNFLKGRSLDPKHWMPLRYEKVEE